MALIVTDRLTIINGKLGDVTSHSASLELSSLIKEVLCHGWHFSEKHLPFLMGGGRGILEAVFCLPVQFVPIQIEAVSIAAFRDWLKKFSWAFADLSSKARILSML